MLPGVAPNMPQIEMGRRLVETFREVGEPPDKVFLGNSSNRSAVFDLQWTRELEGSLKRPISKEQIHPTDHWDFQPANLERKFKKVKENIIFGQHSNKEAQKRQEKLQEIFGWNRGHLQLGRSSHGTNR